MWDGERGIAAREVLHSLKVQFLGGAPPSTRKERYSIIAGLGCGVEGGGFPHEGQLRLAHRQHFWIAHPGVFGALCAMGCRNPLGSRA